MVKLPMWRGVMLAVAFLAATVRIAAAGEFTAEQLTFFENKIRPVLAEQCYSCHGPKKQLNGLRLDSRAGVLRGSDYAKIVVEGKPAESKLMVALRHSKPDEVAPMPKDAAKLPDLTLAHFEQWIAEGLPWPPEAPPAGEMKDPKSHWAFQPVIKPALPTVQAAAEVYQPMDAFVIAKLEENGLSLSPKVDRATRLRRVQVDLLGFSPTFEEIDSFVKDGRPDAYARKVEELLASPHFGERWARHWLDLSRYGDTKGYVFQEERRYPYAYTYRDWVIRAFNSDLPYDRFLKLQIAGDHFSKEGDKADLAALGFLTLGRRFLNNESDIIDDRLDVIFRGTQALTIGCARCHDHKADPIPSEDYYSLYGVLASSTEPKDLPEIAPVERTPEVIKFEEELARRHEKVTAYKRERHAELLQKPTQEKYLQAAWEWREKSEGELRTLAKDRSLYFNVLERWVNELKRIKPTCSPSVDAFEEWAKSAEGLGGIAPDDLEPYYNRAERDKLNELHREIENFKATSPAAPPRAMVLVDRPQPIEPRVFIRGNPGRQGARVPRQFLKVLSPAERKPFSHGSGRAELAEAIANPSNPLTARVFVNRVWAHLMGRPMVDTPSDFGVRTPPPPNPALMDYLAARFMEQGWSVKKLIKEIVLSRTYQQRSLHRPDAALKDPDNAWSWRMERKRMDYEALRDSLLRASGALDLTLFGKPQEDLGHNRRSIYTFIDRQNLPAVLRTFDFASPDTHAPKRFETMVPQQALYLLNSPFIQDQAKRLADTNHAATPEERVQRIFRAALSRNPSPEELASAIAYADEAPPGSPQTGTPWSFGYGTVKDDGSIAFQPFPWFGKDRWSGSERLPDEKLGYAFLHKTGGHAGQPGVRVIRRYHVLQAAEITIEGEVSSQSVQSSGMIATLWHSQRGKLAEWPLAGGAKAATRVEKIAVQPGDTLDFMIDCGENDSYDGFQWAPVLKTGETVLAKAKDGMAAPRNDRWEALAQALLCSNEFVFLD